MISITGCAGKTGRAILGALVTRRAPVRALVQREGRVAEMIDLGAAQAAIADLSDTASLERALAGSSTVLHICPNLREDEVPIGQRVIEACRRVGVERLVYHSVLHPQIEAMPHHWRKLRVEELLLESGLCCTILQPAAYMQNLRAQWRSVQEKGILAVPYSASTQLAMVDLRDVAEVAARVLTDRGHDFAIYELSGPEVLDQREVAAVLASGLGRTVDVEVLDRDLWAAEARSSGLGDYAIDSLVSMFAHYEEYGFRGCPRTLESLLQRPPTTFEQVVERWINREQI